MTCHWNSKISAQNCVLENLKVYVDRIRVANGNEEIESVKGRKESDEFPSYEQGCTILLLVWILLSYFVSPKAPLKWHASSRARSTRSDSLTTWKS